jgi:erythromycin esterase-like protein
MKKMPALLSILLSMSLTQACTEKQSYESSDTATTEVSASDEKLSDATNDMAKEYEAYVGTYKMEKASFQEVVITKENSQLYAQASGEKKVEIYPETKDKFAVPAFNASILFKKDDAEKVTGITVFLEGNELAGIKMQ